MNRRESDAVVACLFAHYPRAAVPADSREAWAYALAEHEFVDGIAAANDLGRTSRYPPSLADLLDATRRLRGERLAERPIGELRQPGAITFSRWLAEYATADERKTVRRVMPALAAKYGIGLAEPTKSAHADGREQL
jgi:hypothetical protein